MKGATLRSPRARGLSVRAVAAVLCAKHEEVRMHTGSHRAPSIRPSRSWLAAICLLGTVACGGDDAASGDDAPAAIADGGTASTPAADAAPDAPPAPVANPLFMIHSAVTDPDSSRSNYFTLTKSLAEPAELDYGQALVLKGRPRLYAQPDLGFFAIADAEKLTITRYTLDASDKMVAGASFSIQQLGIKSLGAQAVHFVNATKAYYKSAEEGLIVVFNPTEMTVTRTIELPRELLKAGANTGSSQWAAADGQAYFAMGWTSKEYDRVQPGVKLVRVDTTTDEVTLTDETRCRGLYKTANVDGALYFFSDVINAFGYAVHGDEGGQPACALRINKGASGFDPSYVGNVGGAFGPNLTGAVMSVADGTAWAQVADLTITPKALGTTYTQWYAKGWRWYRVPFATLQNATPAPSQVGAYGAFTITEGKAFFISEASQAYGKTTLLDVSTETPKPGVSFAGFLLDVARLR